jgi:hypothetical protein
MKTWLERNLQQTAKCVYSNPCECGRSHIGKTGRALTVRLCKQDHNFKDSLLEISKLSKHACGEGHTVIWDEARIFEIESNSRYRKYMELAHMACLTNPISQPSKGISHIWIPLINNEVTNSKRSL